MFGTSTQTGLDNLNHVPMSRPQPCIVLDLDDTLNLLKDEIYQSTRARGFDIHPREWRQYDVHCLFGMTVAEFQGMLVEHASLERAQPDPMAAAAVCKIVESGLKPRVWTARGAHPRAELVTRDWLVRHGLGDAEATILPYGRSKGLHAKECGYLDSIVGFVDDHPGHVADMSRLIPAERCVLLTRSWNEDAPYTGPRATCVLEAVSQILAVTS